ncbi:MAG: TIGR03663 family protein [Chloroflexi bacterium]|nr:TIGR03663 family protein [Chloroflexota bacterium]
MQNKQEKQTTWLDRSLLSSIKFNWELVIFSTILILVVISRFYDLDSRVMSHDESLHTYYSWLLSRGGSFSHTPMMHGPFQFHVVALSYFMFGDSDFTARIPVVLASILAIGFLWNYRSYLGRIGTLVAAGMFLISPYLLYYGRYVRNEAFVVLFGIITIWAILKHLETGENRFLYYLTAAASLHFTTKETSFIYTAQALLFLGFLLLYRLAKRPSVSINDRRVFSGLLVFGLILLILASGSVVFAERLSALTGSETAIPAIPGVDAATEDIVSRVTPITIIFGSLGVLALIIAPLFLLKEISSSRSKRGSFINLLFSLGSIGALIAIITGYSIYIRDNNILEDLLGAAASESQVIAGSSISSQVWLIILAFSILSMALAVAAYFFMQNLYRTLPFFKNERSFDLLVLLASLVLPHLAAFPIYLLGWNAVDTNTIGLIRTALILIPMVLLSIGIGIGWKASVWLKNAGIFYSIFTIFFTTVFTNGVGFFTGLVGSLGYWLEQQGVRRGGQPWYYYLVVQMPVYEYLAVFVTTLAAGLGLRWWWKKPVDLEDQLTESIPDEEETLISLNLDTASARKHALTLLAFWSVTSFLAYTIAGEKMPWLTVHITFPMLLLGGWAVGRLFKKIDWGLFWQQNGVLALLLLPVFIASIGAAFLSLLGENPPFQGQQLPELQATSTFVFSLLTALGSGLGLLYLFRSLESSQFAPAFLLIIFGMFSLLTARTAIKATYINYDEATEFLVYAHSASGVKNVMTQVEEISLRTTDGLAIAIAFDNDVSWPFTWYLRNYQNQRYYGEDPSRDLRDAPIIIVGNDNFSKIEPIVGQAYYRFDYIRMWWPNQDYFNLTWERVKEFAIDPTMRAALFQIWLNRDYSLYANVIGQDLSLPNWHPSDSMRMYIRKDVVAQLWNYGVPAAPEAIVADPYEDNEVQMLPDITIGQMGPNPGEFSSPRSIALAPDASFYVADSFNYRIQHFSSDGTFLDEWGIMSPFAEDGHAFIGTFKEPWGVAVSPDGNYVYVADTWNNRIQKFNSQGVFLTEWGTAGQGFGQDGFYGPRGIAVDNEGNVYVADTGNKRIMIYDSGGNYLTEFGSFGFGSGDFNEPVGLAIDPNSQRIYIVDTWNQRVQVYENEGNLIYSLADTWQIAGWYGESLENKPYITVDENGNVYITDPDGSRVIGFTSDGEFLHFWTLQSIGLAQESLPIGIAADRQGGIWVTDGRNNRLLHFMLP